MRLLFNHKDLIYIIIFLFIFIFGIIDIEIPNCIKNLFNSLMFQVIILALIALFCNNNNQISFTIAFLYVVIYNIILKQKINNLKKETYLQIS